MHLGIVDDPIKDQEEANSVSHLDKIWRWYKTAFKTRMMPNAAIILPMTRWATMDLCGRVLNEEGAKWTVINLPAYAGSEDPLGRAEGEPLWPEWYGADALADMFETLEPREWAALYQGKPIAEGGNLFKREWFGESQRYTVMPRYTATVQYWDTAYELTEGRSYSVCTTWRVCDNGFFLVDVFRKRLEFPDLRLAVEHLANKFRPIIILVEKRASGTSLVQDLQKTSRYTILAIQVVKNKFSRAASVTSLCSSGRVFIPAMATWVHEWLAELEEFPGGQYDDQVDSTVGALTYLRDNYTFSSSGINPENRVEMAWDIYRNKQEASLTRDWDVYNRRFT